MPSETGGACKLQSKVTKERRPINLRRCRLWLSRRQIGRSGPPDHDHARLHLACTLPFIFSGILPGATVRYRAGNLILIYNTNKQGRGAARARGLSAPARRLRCGGAARRRRPCAHEGKKAWSGARALRENTCDANAKWETVYASDGLGRATTIARNVRRARIKKVNIRVRGQNAKQSDLIAISLGFCDIANCIRGFDARNVRRAQVGYKSD
eukprot:2782429-Pleurochrysis_carterae.AAC.4